MFNFQIVFDNFDLYINGFFVTIHLTALSLLIGFALSLPLALIRHRNVPVLNQLVFTYTYFFRGTPLLIQMYLIYYGMGQFEAVRESFLWYFFKEAYFCGLFAFVLNTTAYTTEIIKGALDTIDKREVEAAVAFGLSKVQAYARIVIPNALRRSLPPYSNEVIFMFHASALASVITITDLTSAARYLYSKYYDPFTPFIIAALFYLGIVFLIVMMFKFLEHKFLAFLGRPEDRKKLFPKNVGK